MGKKNALTALNTRVWYVEGGVHPTRTPEFLALGKFSTDPSKTIGEATKISAPDPNSFNRDISIGTVPGTEERATLAISTRDTPDLNALMRWANRKCRVDIFALRGKCGTPQDFTQGGEKWVFFPDGQLSNHSFENFGAFGQDENNPANQIVDMTSDDYWTLMRLRQAQIGSSVTVREIYTVDVYTGNECENCPDPCDRVLATMAGASATPGTQPILLFSEDGGLTFDQQTIDTLFSNEVISDAEVIGGDFVLISNTANELHWTNIELLYDGTNAWNQVDSGFVLAKGPNAMSSADPGHTWVVGDGGYIYFAKNYKTGVIVQDAGVLTTQNLNDVHAFDSENVLTVGNSNAMAYTTDGGSIWQSVTGPSVGVNLGACNMWDEETWFVGEGAGGSGKLWLTTNSGKTWSEVTLPGNYTRIYDIEFVSEGEGYIAAGGSGQGFVLRTITAGNLWVVLPEGKQGLAADNTYIQDLAVCNESGNTAFGAGLADNGTAGIILKMNA